MRAELPRLLFLGLSCLSPVAAPAVAAQAERPQHPCWVRGRVLDADGRPVAGAGIAAGPSATLLTRDALEQPLVRSDADGRFELRVAAPPRHLGTLDLLVAAPGYAAVRCYASPPKEAPKEPMELADLRLPPGGTLKGRVRGPDGMPLAEARVLALDWIATAHGLGSSRTAFSAALTGADGAFTIPCALTEAALVRVVAPGCLVRTVGPVSAGEPLIVELRQGGAIAGRVVDEAGKPLPGGQVSVQYEGGSYSDPEVTTGAEGDFQLSLRYPCRYRVAARLREGNVRVESEVQDGAVRDLVLRLQPAARTGGITLRALDAATGAPIQQFKAAEYWYHPDPFWLENYLPDQAEDSPPDGVMRLRGPQGPNTQSGTVRVSAAGHAPLLLTDVTPKDGEDTVLEAKLKKESVVTGTIVDETTGEPVADAEVQVRVIPEGSNPRAWGGNNQRRFGRRPGSAADGAFRLGELGKGTYEIWPMHRSRPDGRVVSVTLGDEETRADVKLTLPKGWALAGKLVGAPLPNGCRVRYERENLNRYYGPLSEEEPTAEPGTVVPLAADGSFRFTGLPAGGYDLFLLWPVPPRSGAILRLPIERLRLKRADWQRDIDVAADLPGRVQGRLTLDGARLRAGRFAVTAVELPDPNNTMSRIYSSSDNHLAGRRALVAPDGSYDLLLGPGEYRLQAVDLLTGVLLGKDSERIIASCLKPVARDLKVTVAPVRVRLEGDPQGPPWTAARLKIEAAVEAEKVQGNVVIMSSGNSMGGPGVDLSEHPEDLEVLVPPGEVKFTVFSGSNRLARKSRGEQPASLGDASITAKAGEPAVAAVKVGPRPEISDEEKTDADAAAPAPGKAVAPAKAAGPARK